MPSQENFNMMPPIKVALLGAPGSNKSIVARRVSTRLNRASRLTWQQTNPTALKDDEPKKWWAVIDDYVDKLAVRTGRTFGEIYDRSAFALNLQVIAERWTLEDSETTHNINTITCGTVYESLIYSIAQSMTITHLSDEQLIMEESYIAKMMIESIRTVGALKFDYDLLFYLPLDDDKKGHDWATVVDDKLSEVLAGQNLTAIILDGTIKQKVERGTEIIKELQTALTEEFAADYEQRSIRRSNAVDERQESESEPVPNMPTDETTDSREGSGDSGME